MRAPMRRKNRPLRRLRTKFDSSAPLLSKLLHVLQHFADSLRVDRNRMDISASRMLI